MHTRGHAIAGVLLALLWACQGTVSNGDGVDGGERDGSAPELDAGSERDASPSDAGETDGGGEPDAGSPDAGTPTSDAGTPMTDAGVVDPGPRSAGCGIAQEAGFHCMDVMYQGRMRNWCINIPAGYDPDHAHSLVIGLHGCGGNNMAVHRHRAPMEADGEGEFIFIYPQANASCWDYQGSFVEGNDVSFIAHIVEESQAMTCLDTERTFVHGMSSGGSMSPRVVTAGVAIAYASASAGGATGRPTPVWFYAGTADGYWDTISSQVASQIRADGCGEDTTPIAGTPCVQYQDCTAPVTYCEDGRGHVWPSESWAQGGILDVFRAVP